MNKETVTLVIQPDDIEYRIFAGIAIIRKYQPDSDFHAEHDEIFFGYYDETQMSLEDFEAMAELGWTNEYDSWRHNV